jgi:hypothetical protein
MTKHLLMAEILYTGVVSMEASPTAKARGLEFACL